MGKLKRDLDEAWGIIAELKKLRTEDATNLRQKISYIDQLRNEQNELLDKAIDLLGLRKSYPDVVESYEYTESEYAGYDYKYSSPFSTIPRYTPTYKDVTKTGTRTALGRDQFKSDLETIKLDADTAEARKRLGLK